MRSPVAKWFLGLIAFCLPVIVAAVLRRLDHSAVRHEGTYRSLAPIAIVGSLLLAVAVPTILLALLRAPVWRRVGFVLGVWLLLALELYWTFFALAVTP